MRERKSEFRETASITDGGSWWRKSTLFEKRTPGRATRLLTNDGDMVLATGGENNPLFGRFNILPNSTITYFVYNVLHIDEKPLV